MNRNLITLAVAAWLLAGAGAIMAAGEQDAVVDEKLVVALKTEHFEIDETDISHLAVGESETIVTEYGRTVDLLRTEDGVEVYLDGVLLDIPVHDEHHVIHQEIEIVCDTDEECEELAWVTDDGEIDLEALEADGKHKVIVIHEDMEIDGDLSTEDIDIDVEMSEDGERQKVIIIRKKSADEI